MVDHSKEDIFVNCSFITDPDWKWIAPAMSDCHYKWEFFRVPKLAKPYHYLPLNRFKEFAKIASFIKKNPVKLLITHDPHITAWCALFCSFYNISVKHLAIAFHYPDLPQGIKKQVLVHAYRSVTDFITFSTKERMIYHKHFNIPLEKIHFIPWGMNAPKVESLKPKIEGNYICSIGGTNRDYKTLLQAMEGLSNIQLVLVVRPESLEGLKVPSNVKVLINRPLDEAMNIMKFSRALVLPIKESNTAGGHATLISGMHLGCSVIVSKTHSVRDYALEKENSLTYKPEEYLDLRKKIQFLWDRPEFSRDLGNKAKALASEIYTEESVVQNFKSIISSYEF